MTNYCDRGHPRTPNNTRWIEGPDGTDQPICMTCRRADYMRQYRERCKANPEGRQRLRRAHTNNARKYRDRKRAKQYQPWGERCVMCGATPGVGRLKFLRLAVAWHRIEKFLVCTDCIEAHKSRWTMEDLDRMMTAKDALDLPQDQR